MIIKVHTAVFHQARPFDHNDRISAVRDRGSRHDPDRLPGVDGSLGRVPRGDFVNNLKGRLPV